MQKRRPDRYNRTAFSHDRHSTRTVAEGNAMSADQSVFFDFNLPNATTWFYFSGLLAVALFFKFSRLLSVRNWDVVSLFLLVPGMLLLLESRMKHAEPNWFGYLWLLCGSGYFLVRCLWDLALVRRPALAPNLNLA